MKLGIRFREDSVKISANGKDYIVKYDEITEVRVEVLLKLRTCDFVIIYDRKKDI